jgi:ABC-type polysaccharide/polyol phosphate transport system ATPase subunit
MSSVTVSEASYGAPAYAGDQKEVIRLENVSVAYRVPQERIDTFKEYTIRWMQGKVKHRKFLALQDVSLSVYRGEVLGLIGQNGAGKSTLLKLVARVLRPTSGRVVVQGRVAPLLEIGAGFHPELTGRENIFLNGAMLGFSRKQMEEKFQRILDFAELGDFIEAPLRTYSSGMWARLGFAVATDTQPEVLIVDEILSVGDEAFQRKSLERIQSFQAQGATILVVSHTMDTIEKMCQKAIWLDHGKIIASGEAGTVVDSYLGRVRDNEARRLAQESEQAPVQRWGEGGIEIRQVRILNKHNVEQHIFHTGETLVLQIDFYAHEPLENPTFGIAIHRQDGLHITGPNTDFAGLHLGNVDGAGSLNYTIPYLPLLEGLYNFSVSAHDEEDTHMYDYHDRLYPFRVDNRGQQLRERYGLMTMRGKWRNL